MRLGLNVFAIAVILVGVVAGAIAATFLRASLAFAAGAAAACVVDLGYRIVRRDFEGPGGYLSVRHALGSPTRIPVWIIAFALAAGVGVVSLLKQPDATTTASSVDRSSSYQPAYPTEPASPPSPTDNAPKATVEPAKPIDRTRAKAFLAFFKRWQKVLADTHDCTTVTERLREVSRESGQAVRDVYSSGLSLPDDVQTEFSAIRDQLKTAAAACPDLSIDDEIARVAAGQDSAK